MFNATSLHGHAGLPSTPVDLTSCDREPVHAPNAIQPFGAVLVARRSDLRVTHASANLDLWAGVDVHASIGGDLADIIGSERANEVGRLATDGRLKGNPFSLGTISTGAPARPVHLSAHTAGEHLIVTAEPAEGDTGATELAALKHAIERLRVPGRLLDLCGRLAEEVRRLTGFDRVMVYRFHPDHSGEVVAESVRAGFPTYLGLNYPAADIPVPAREIYKKVWVRVIPDVAAPPVPLVSATDEGPIDLTHCPLRAVSPIHVEYLTNMGVTATMSLSLLRGTETELWGLVACHHYSPRRLPGGTRQACELVAQVASHSLIAAEDRETLEDRAAARVAHDAMVGRAARPGVTLATLADDEPGLLDLVSASGAAVRVYGEWVRRGDAPGGDDLEAFAGWLETARPAEKVYATDDLKTAYPPAAGWANGACGVLAVRVWTEPRDLLVWCRPEDARTVRWAGDPTDKPVSYGPHGSRLHPRRSFDEWRESVRGRSAPWTAAEVDTAARLAAALRELVLVQAERLLRATRLFETVAGATTDAIVVTDASGGTLFCNAAAARIAGQSAAQVLGQNPTAERDRRIVATGAGEEYEEVLTVDGRERTYHVVKAPFRDARGEVAGVVGISRDITERKVAEKTIVEARTRLEEAQRAARLGSWVWDEVAGRVWWSDGCYEVLGLDPASGPPSFEKFLAMIHPDDRDAAAGREAAVRAGANEFAADVRFVRPDGRVVWVHSRARAVRGPGGELIRVEGIDQDVTDRKHAELALRDSDERFRALFDHASDAIFLQEDGGRVLDVNRAACESLGYTRDELVGLFPADFDQTVSPALMAELTEQFRAGGTAAFDSVHRRKDGSTFPVEVRCRPFHLGGRPVGLAVARDITDRKRSEAELRAERDRMAKVIEIAPVVICSFQQRADGSSCFPYASRRIEELYGIPADQLIADATPAFAMIHPDDVGRVTDEIVASARDLTVWRSEFRIRNPSRGEIWVEGCSAPVRQPDGSIVWHGYIADITARKSDDLVRARLAAVVESSDDAICTKSIAGEILTWNAGAARLFGYTAAEAVGRPITMLFPPDRLAEEELILGRILGGERVQHFDTVRVQKGGRRVDVSLTVSPIRDAGGRIIGASKIARDITDRKRAEAALRDRERLLADVTSAAQVGLVMVGAGYEYLFANETYAEVLGLGEEPIVGRRVPDVLPAAWDQIRPRLDRALAGERVAFELEIPGREGEPRHYRVIYEPRPDAAGRLVVVVVVVDVTDQKQAQDDLRGERDRFAKIVQTVPGVIFSFRQKPDGTACVPYCSPRVRDLLGIVPEDIRDDAAPILNLIHPDDSARFEESVAASARDLTPWQAEYRMNSLSRGEVWVEGHSVPIRDADGGTTWHGAIADVTERKRAEAELEQRVRDRTADLVAVNRELEAFSYSVSHDLRAPIRHITGFAGILLESCGPQLSEANRGHLEQVARAAQRMGHLVDDLLAFSRLGRLPLHR